MAQEYRGTKRVIAFVGISCLKNDAMKVQMPIIGENKQYGHAWPVGGELTPDQYDVERGDEFAFVKVGVGGATAHGVNNDCHVLGLHNKADDGAWDVVL